ncbi:hypothetical protein BDW68DRAFT_192192 [Aspergillus falconensis]
MALEKAQVDAAVNAVTALFPKQIVQAPSATFKESQEGYWNTIQRRKLPACFFQPTTVAEVQQGLVEVVKAGCPFAIKSGGHSSNPEGSSVEGGFQFDLRNLNHVEVSDDRMRVRVGPGMRWGDLYLQLERQGLTAVGGRDFGVGVAGFVFGGGISYFSTKHGWGIDNLESVDIVLANGHLVVTSAESHRDLFKALRGGGAHNFGIVTSLTLKVHPYNGFWGGRNVVAEEHFDELFRAYDQYTRDLVKDVNAHMIVDFFRHDGRMVAVQFMGYTEPVANPTIYDRICAIPSVDRTLRLADHSNLAAEMAEVTDSRGKRNAYWTLAMGYDINLLRSVYNVWAKITAPFSDRLRFALDVNHITPAMRIKAAREGRENVYGLEDLDVTMTLVLLTAVWEKESDDDEVNLILKRLYHAIESLTREFGHSHSFRYMNYAHHEQDVIAGFGDANKLFLLEVAARYDPEGIFQHLQRGGFKLSPSKRARM